MVDATSFAVCLVSIAAAGKIATRRNCAWPTAALASMEQSPGRRPRDTRIRRCWSESAVCSHRVAAFGDLERSPSLAGGADALLGAGADMPFHSDGRTPSAPSASRTGSACQTESSSWTDVSTASLAFRTLRCRCPARAHSSAASCGEDAPAGSPDALEVAQTVRLEEAQAECGFPFEFDLEDWHQELRGASADVRPPAEERQGESCERMLPHAFSNDVVRALQAGKTLLLKVRAQPAPDLSAGPERLCSGQGCDSNQQCQDDVQGLHTPAAHTVAVCLSGISDEEYIWDILGDLKSIIARGEQGYWCYGTGAYIDSMSAQ